jgi:hypothetical protein
MHETNKIRVEAKRKTAGAGIIVAVEEDLARNKPPMRHSVLKIV